MGMKKMEPFEKKIKKMKPLKKSNEKNETYLSL